MKHIMETGHEDWPTMHVLSKESQYPKRIFKEAFSTKALKNGNRVFLHIDSA